MESPGRGRGGNGGVGRGRGGTKRENKKSINKGHAGRGKFQQERGKGKSARGAASLRGRGGKAVQEQPPPRHQQGGPRSDVSSAQRFSIGRLGPLTKKPLPPGDQHRMRKLVLSALNCENDDEVVRLLTTVPGISSLQTIATTVFSIDAGDRRGLFSFQAIAVPFCRLLRTRIAISSDFSGVIKIFSQLCRGGSTFFSLERGSAISCLIECATEPEMIVAGAGQDDNTKYLPRSVQEMFDDVLDAIRQLFVNMKDEAKQEKWPGILSLLEVHVPTACLQNFTHIRSLVMEGNGQQQLQTGELGRKARTGARPILSANSLPGELCPTGARHDNDHEDYRQIRVLPTSQEMHSEVQPYLPKQYLLEKDDHRGSEFLVDDVDRHVDIQFRLLREDMVRTLRCGTQALAHHGGLPGLAPRKYRHRLRVQSSAIHCAIMRNVAIVGFVPSSRTALAFKVSFDHPCPNDKKFWDPKVCRLLRKGQLVSVLLDSSHQLSLTATVSGRIEQQAPSSRCVVELELVAGTKENIALLLQYADSRREETTEIGLMEIGGVQIFAYKPVLSALQAQTSAKVPFLRRVVPSKGQPECCTERLPAFVTPSTRLDLRCLVRDGVAVPPELASVSIDSYAQLEALFERPRVEESLRMDRTQAKAFAAAFSRDIALIQGPPGTGKTFVGVEILRALLSNSVGYPRTTWDEATPPATEIDGKPLLDPIVCITFTNHALDQILEHLIDEGIATTADIVRLGSRSKSERLEKCSLYAKERDEWSGRDGWEKYSMEDRAEKVIKEIENAMKMLSRREGAAWTEHVLEFLDPDLLFQLERTLAREIESGFEDVDGSGCLAMLRRQSLEEYNLYQEMAEEALVEDIFYKFQALEKLSDDIERLRTGVKLRVAKKARVIAMTTTGCAMHSQLIKMLRPKVILCEEAGEVLESHMLSALTDRTQSLILIGDHLQLRPKPAEYDLSVESGRGYDLDVSLFERLVMSRAPSVMLLEQRRMQPRISSLLRYTLYPLLVDHPSVEQHPPLRGFAESLLFFDHDHPEVGASESTSKVNRFEVEMVTAIVEYAVRNGYQGSRVAVLTPYLGQLRHIRLALSGHKMTVFVDERTEEDLLEEKLLGEDVIEEDDGQEPATQPTDAASFSVEKLRDCVRLSTVDNFQGEEADLVIVSTVRCNTEGSVGFLATDNRVNVMLSRARHGMIILGSSRTVFHKLGSRGKPPTMFQTVLRLLEAESAVVRALPLICERHPNEVTLAKTPGDVPKHGGCERPCTSRLSCGHRCRSLCHPDNKSHQAVACREDCAKLLACGHPCKELCQKPCGNCREQVLCTLPCGHGITLSCDRATAFKQNPAGSGIVCIREVPVPKHLQKLACGHVLEKALCHELKASALTCVKECSKSPWDCGHSCTRPCSECHRPGLPPNHGLCSHPCGRVLLCGHICTATPCHDGSSCPPCQEKCAIRCAHSTCPLPCQAACNPCVEPCVWKCTVEHEGMQKCVLRCSAACTRRPCDVRCDQILMCGHRCPSLCGEVCPDAGGCPQCAAEGKLSPDRASSIVDFIMYVELKDHTVDDGDIGTCLVQLNCGHAFTVEYLDTKTQLESFYERSQDSWGQPTFLDTFTLENKQMAKCDLCPAPLLGPRRYSRCIKGREVHLLDVKWSHDCKVKLAEIETMVSSLPAGQGSTKAFNAVKKDASVFYNSVVKLKRASPAEKCIPHNQLPRAAATRAAMARAHACAAQCLVEVEMIKRKLAAVSRQPSEKNAEHEDAFRHHKKALWLLDRLEKMYKEGLAYATDGSSSTAASTLHGNFAKGLCQVFELLHTLTSRTPHPPSREIMQRTLSSLKGLVAGDQAVKAKFAAIVPVLTMQLDKARDMTADEKRAVFTAMQRDVGSGIGGYGGHWFECPNGHPYAIGECGGAMEVSKCIDCGAEVGGSSHRRRSDNKVAVGLLSSVGGPIPSRLS